MDEGGYRADRADLVVDGELCPGGGSEHKVEVAFIGFVVLDAAPVELGLGAEVVIDAQD